MTVGEILKRNLGGENELLLAHVLRQPKEFLFLHPEFKLSDYQAKKLQGLIRRRKQGEPLAYLLGTKEFCGLKFKVDKRVLVPRPETEWVVEKVASLQLKILKNHKKIRILDVGTGSGAIIVSLAKILGRRGYEFWASDISESALQLARYNARKNRVRVKFVKSDLLKNIPQDCDVLVANLPYGWPAWKNHTSNETVGLKYEPQRALFARESGLREIRRLLMQLAARKNLPGYTYLEFDPRQKSSLSLLAKKILPLCKIKFYRDLTGRWRYMEVRS